MNADQVVSSPGFKLSSGDVERFHIWVYARQRHVIEWSLELPMIVNGKRLTMPIQGPTDLTFKTAGAEAPVRELLRSGSDWVPRDADEAQQLPRQIERPLSGAAS
jgi:hypothetical protein